MGIFKIDDIIAALILSIAMFRRLETISTRKADNSHVPEQAFEAWRAMALRGYNWLAAISLAKIALSVLWFLAFQNSPRALQVGGLLVFLGWLGGIVYVWRMLTEAGARKRELAIGRPPDA